MSLWVVPGWEPVVSGIPESVDSVSLSVGPWLSTLAVWEVFVSTTNSNVEDQIELLVKRSTLVGLVLPWIVVSFVKFTLGKHVFVELEVQHFFAIDRCDDVVGSPVEAVDMEVI
jgi:hypothetical protein